jgi:hypothetical protein
MSGQQYWLWTYQRPGQGHLPQVVDANPEFCGRTFYGEYGSAEELRKVFVDTWSAHLGVPKDAQFLTHRYSLKKSEEGGTNQDLSCQKTIPAVDEATSVAPATSVVEEVSEIPVVAEPAVIAA